MKTRSAERAVKLFDSGFNCAESVLFGLSQELGRDSSIIPRIATGFGGGIGRSGQTCGALTGAIMTIGLLKGCDKGEEESEKRNAAYETVRQMLLGFEEEFGNTQCRILTQCDLKTQEGQSKFRREGIRKNLCPKLIGWCADYVTDLAEK